MDLARRLRDASPAEVRASYDSLKTYNCNDPPGLSRAGLKALDRFFLHWRLRSKTKKHISFVDAMADPTIVKHLNELVRRYKKLSPRQDFNETQDLLRMQYQVFQLYYGTINQFRPALAKWLICRYSPKIAILDPTAGWGGRCMAAMSLGIPYIGIDANTHLEKSYNQMIAALEPTAKVKMIFSPAEKVDFSKFAYDMILTSPPYFMLEKYEKMPEYKSKSDFLERFFKPTITAIWSNLLPGGRMVINIPEEMYNTIAADLPSLQERLTFDIPERHPKQAALARGVLDLSKNASRLEKNKEYIYVWMKPALIRKTRRRQTGGRNKTIKRTVYCRDSFPWLKAHPGSQAAIVTSIPEMDEIKNKSKNNLVFYENFFRTAAAACLTATAPSGYTIFLQTDRKYDGWIDKTYWLIDEAKKQGRRLIWHKIALRTTPGKIDLYRPGYSHMLCFSATAPVGKPLPDVVDRGSVTYPNAFGRSAVELAIQYLVDAGVKSVVDPFSGSGTTLAVANAAGLSAVGFDIDKKMCAVSKIQI